MIQRRMAVRFALALVVCAGSVLSDPIPATPPTRPSNRFQSHYLIDMKGHVDTVNSLAVSPDGKLVVSGSNDTTVRVWDLTTRKQLLCIEGHTGAVKSVAFSPDGKLVASGSEDRTARVWDLATGRPICQFERASDRVNCVAFSASGKSLMTGSCDTNLRIWSIAEDKLLREIKMSSCVYFIAASKDDSRIACGMHDGSVVVIDGASAQKIISLQAITKGSLDAVAINSEGSRLVTFGGASGLGIWELPSGRQLVKQASTGTGHGSVIAPDGNTFTLARGIVEIRDLTTGKVLRTYRPDYINLAAAAFTPDGKFLITGGRLNTSPAPRPADRCGIQIWDLAVAEGVAAEPSLYKADPAGWTDLWPNGKLDGWNAYDWPPGPAAAKPTAQATSAWTWDRELGTFRSPPKGIVQWLGDRDYSDFVLHFEYRFQEHGKHEFQSLVRMRPGQMVCNSISGTMASSTAMREGVAECQPVFMLHPVGRKWQAIPPQYPDAYPNEWRKAIPRDKRPPAAALPKDLGPDGEILVDKPWNWNSLDIVVKGDTITSYVNGKMVSRCIGVPAAAGRVGFFTDNTDVELFNVKIKPLKQ